MINDNKFDSFEEMLAFCTTDDITHTPGQYNLVKCGKKRGIYNVHSFIQEKYDIYFTKDILIDIIRYRIPVSPDLDIFLNNWKMFKFNINFGKIEKYEIYLKYFFDLYRHLAETNIDDYQFDKEGLLLDKFGLFVYGVKKEDLINEKKRWNLKLNEKKIDYKFMEYFANVYRIRHFHDSRLNYVYRNYNALEIAKKILADDDYYEIIGVDMKDLKNELKMLKDKKEKLEYWLYDLIKKTNNDIERREGMEALKKINIIYDTLTEKKSRQIYDSAKKNILNNSVILNTNSSLFSEENLKRIEDENKNYKLDFKLIKENIEDKENFIEIFGDDGDDETKLSNIYPKGTTKYPKASSVKKYKKGKNRKNVYKRKQKKQKDINKEKINNNNKIISSVINPESDIYLKEYDKISNCKSFEAENFREIISDSEEIKIKSPEKTILKKELQRVLSDECIENLTERRENTQLIKREKKKYDEIFSNRKPFFLKKGIVSLANEVNTCYINSVIQLLLNTPLLKAYFSNYNNYKEDISNNCAILKEFININNYCWCKKDVIQYDMKNFLTVLYNNSHFREGVQDDAADLLGFLLENFNQNLNKIKNIPKISIKKEINDYRILFDIEKLKEQSFIKNSFYVDILNTIKCSNCHRINFNIQSENIITLEIKGKSLYECLTHYLKPERVLDYKCVCGCDTCYKKLDFINTNDILIFCFKRFRSDRSKINSYINFPNYLIIDNFIKDRTNKKKTLYHLYGIINHWNEIVTNKKIYEGHYTTFAFNFEQNTWIGFSDSKIVRLLRSEIRSNFAFIVCYIKANYDIDKNNQIMKINPDDYKNFIYYNIKDRQINNNTNNNGKEMNITDTSIPNNNNINKQDIEMNNNDILINNGNEMNNDDNQNKIINNDKFSEIKDEDLIALLAQRYKEFDFDPENFLKEKTDRKIELQKNKRQDYIYKKRMEFKSIYNKYKKSLDTGYKSDEEEVFKFEESQNKYIFIGDKKINVPKTRKEYCQILENYKDLIFKVEGDSSVLATKEDFEKSGNDFKTYFFLPKKMEFYTDINKKITKRDYLENIRTMCIICGKVILYDSLFSHTLDFHYFFFNRECMSFYDFDKMLVKYFKRKINDHISSFFNTSNQIRFCFNLVRRFSLEKECDYSDYVSSINRIYDKMFPEKYEHEFTEGQIKDKRGKNKGKANRFANERNKKEIKSKKFDDFRSKSIFARNESDK